MTAKKIRMIILLCIVSGGLVFIFILYFTLKMKTTSLNDDAPFQPLIGKTVVLHRETALFQESKEIYKDTDVEYPYLLLDSLHPSWQGIKDRLAMPQPDVKYIGQLPAGTQLSFEKAVMYTNGATGSSTPALFGVIENGNNTYKIQYRWGHRSYVYDPDRPDKPWDFSFAPWQKEQDGTYYALPEAKWW